MQPPARAKIESTYEEFQEAVDKSTNAESAITRGYNEGACDALRWVLGDGEEIEVQ